MVRFLNSNKFFIVLLIILGISFQIIPNFTVAQSTVEQEQANRAKLEQELAALEKELAAATAQLNSQKGQSSSLRNDIALLTSRINQNKLDIRAKNVLIEKLGGEINDRNKTIYSLTEKIERERASMAQLIKKSYELQDETSFVHVLMSGQTLSDFYRDLDDFQSIQDSINESMGIIRQNKVVVEGEKIELIKKQDEQENAKAKIEAAKRAVELSEKEKQKLLSVSQNQEKNYAKVVAERQARIASIRAELIRFQGSGVESRSISFGEAYDYAKKASAKTGVRTALILAIMQQETAFGNNVGGCYVTQRPVAAVNGVFQPDGIYIKSGNPSRKTMIPSNYDNFLKITSSLGLDWKKTPVSCALVNRDGSLFGFGGAMGYTQFIPTTWMSVEARVRQYTGASAANPWNPEHAVIATAIFLRDLGANSQTYTAERNSACRYYGACSTYADSVMKKAANIQQTINQLEQFSN